MNASGSSFPETNRKKQLRICGNCARVSFGLNGEEAEFLKETVQYHGAQRMCRWIQRGYVKGSRGGFDPEKMRAIAIIVKHKANCKVAAAQVLLIEKHCFLWLPAPENQF